MKGENGHIDQFEAQFADAVSAWDEAPAPALWDQLEAELDSGATGATPSWRPTLWIVGILLLVAGRLALAFQPSPEAMTTPLYSEATSLTESVPAPAGMLADTSADALADTAAREIPVPATVQPRKLKLQIDRPLPERSADIDPADWQSVLDREMPATNIAPFDYRNAGINRGNMVVTNRAGNVIDTVQSIRQYRSSARSGVYANRGEFLQINSRRNNMEFHPRSFPVRDKTSDISQFNWLLGSWKNNGPGGASEEEWTQVDEFTLEGRGFFVVNGDTIVTEKMRIEQKGEEVYYIVALDTLGNPMRFRLRSRKQGQAVFEPTAPGQGGKLIYRQSPEGYSTETKRLKDERLDKKMLRNRQ